MQSASARQRPTKACCNSSKLRVDLVDRVANPKPQIGGDLVVAAAGRVQFAAHVAQPVDQGPLDVHVDVFQFGAELEGALLNFLADFLQALLNLAALVGGDQADGGQHLGMGDRADDILRLKRRSKLTLSVNFSTRAVSRLAEYTLPRFGSHAESSAR